MDLQNYMNNQENLPDFIKDFHDQKDLFKAIYEQWKDGEHKTLENVSWVDAHVFTIDYFLQWMGLHGYKLQKIRKKDIEFYDIEETIEQARLIRLGKETEMLSKALKQCSR